MILRLTLRDNFWYIDIMRLLFVADGRSPIATNWIRHFTERGDEVYLASTSACAPDLALKGLELTPVAFSQTKVREGSTGRPSSANIRLLTTIRHWLGPLTIARASRRLREIQTRLQPDLVHAMRIPFEGMLTADAFVGIPVLLSVWGNDFTLHAASTAMMRHYTSWALQVAQALHADCNRDLRLSRQWGFDPAKRTLVVPGNGGVRTDVFHFPTNSPEDPVVINPRGSRSYVRTDVFLRAIPLVLTKVPRAKFICAALGGDKQAIRLIESLEIGEAVDLLPPIPYPEMGELFRRAQVVVSPSTHDGTPNSLLEGMACGCMPVAGDLDSIREWITDGRNGLLVDPTDPRALADGIIEALNNKDLRRRAAGLNQELIGQRAEYGRCMAEVSQFYQRIVSDS